MQNIGSNLSQPKAGGKPPIFRISLITLIVSCLELTFREFKCNLGEFFSLFWVNFIFLIVLFYWPTYLAKEFSGEQINSLSKRFSLFSNILLKVAFYMLFIAMLMVFILGFIGMGVSDNLVFLPLIFLWPLYVWLELKRNIKKVILPFSISMIALVGIQLMNIPNPTLETFDTHLKAFEEVVAMVRSGELKPESNSTIKLPCKYRYLVGCPNRQILVGKQGNATEIFFCNDKSRFANGITGFVYTDGKDISLKSFNNSVKEVKKLKEHWFWRKII